MIVHHAPRQQLQQQRRQQQEAHWRHDDAVPQCVHVPIATDDDVDADVDVDDGQADVEDAYEDSMVAVVAVVFVYSKHPCPRVVIHHDSFGGQIDEDAHEDVAAVAVAATRHNGWVGSAPTVAPHDDIVLVPSPSLSPSLAQSAGAVAVGQDNAAGQPVVVVATVAAAAVEGVAAAGVVGVAAAAVDHGNLRADLLNCDPQQQPLLPQPPQQQRQQQQRCQPKCR